MLHKGCVQCLGCEQRMHTSSAGLSARRSHASFVGPCSGLMAAPDAAGSMPDELEQDS